MQAQAQRSTPTVEVMALAFRLSTSPERQDQSAGVKTQFCSQRIKMRNPREPGECYRDGREQGTQERESIKL